MLIGDLIGARVLAALSVSPSTTDIFRQGVTGTVYGGIQFNTSGAEWGNGGAASTSFTVSRGNWLDNGASSSVWIERTVSGDPLNWKDPGTGRFQLNTTREYGLSIDFDGTYITDVTFDFYDAASGGNLLATVGVQFEIIRGF